ncbi:MAG: nitroreductase family deazaflavin-dependent oxidoreductase [Chloroflexota bacterium]
MAKQVKQLQPPKGCSRILFRTPIWFYRLGLGWLFGRRMLLLIHTGRISGQSRQAVLEVVQHQADKNTYIVAVGFGQKSQWYQNLLVNPWAKVQVGLKKWDVVAEQLSPQVGAEAFRDFCKNNPGEARLAGLLGYEVDGSEEDFRKMGEMMIFIGLQPR